MIVRTVVAKDLTSFTNDGIITLTRAVRAITSNPPQPVPESLQALFQLCDFIVLNGRNSSQSLYDKIKMEIEKQASQIRKSLAELTSTENQESWLRNLKLEWKRYCDALILVRSVFLGLDRGFILNSVGLLSIWFVSPLFLIFSDRAHY